MVEMPYVVFGGIMMGIGVWLIRTPRQSRIGLFLGPMIRFRIFGIILVVFGLFALLVGLGLRSIGSVPIPVN